MMKHLTILVPEGANYPESIVGAYRIFTLANEYWEQNGKEAVFHIELAGLSKEIDFYGNLFTIKTQITISKIAKSDLIIIPSVGNQYQPVGHQYQQVVTKNKALVDWIRHQYKEGAELASICMGAFLLAATGLLDGKSCSTHWISADQFRSMFPKVNLQPNQLITDEAGIYTNGGAYSFLNLVIYLVEKYFDRQTAIYCSKIFQIDMDRQSQSAFIIFKGQKMHGDEMVEQAQGYIEEQVHQKLSVKQLAKQFAVSRRQFDRRFIKATGNTPFEYVQRVKVETAKKLLEVGRKTVNEVMYEVGYSDASAFRKVFKGITSLSPVEYRNRYNKEAAV